MMRILIFSDFARITPKHYGLLKEDIDVLVLAGDFIDDGYAEYYKSAEKEAFSEIISEFEDKFKSYFDEEIKEILKEAKNEKSFKLIMKLFEKINKKYDWFLARSMYMFFEYSRMYNSYKFLFKYRKNYLEELEKFLTIAKKHVNEILFLDGNNDKRFYKDYTKIIEKYELENVNFKEKFDLFFVPFLSLEDLINLESFYFNKPITIIAHLEYFELPFLLEKIFAHSINAIVLSHKPILKNEIIHNGKKIPVYNSWCDKYVIIEKEDKNLKIINGKLY